MSRTQRKAPTTQRATTPNNTTDDYIRSIEMDTMHEALARERMRDGQRRSRDAQVAGVLAAQRRWHRVSLRARAAQARHARQVEQLPAR